MQLKKNVGYTIYSHVEELFREWLEGKLTTLYGNEWVKNVPKGILDKCNERNAALALTSSPDISDFFDETDYPDLTQILLYKRQFKQIIGSEFDSKSFEEVNSEFYRLRCKIAHVKKSFNTVDLVSLIDLSRKILSRLSISGNRLTALTEAVFSGKYDDVIEIPTSFYLDEDTCSLKHLNNLPEGDYDEDGGYIGRKSDISKIKKLVTGATHRVVTVSGAGGVGKTALVHKMCQDMLDTDNFPFDALIWVSAKDEKLGLSGIEKIDPTFKNYEDLLDSILVTCGWHDGLDNSIDQKEEDVELLMSAGDKGILIVIDNLETVEDQRVVDFIIDMPPPSKALITSRLGIGQVERRYPLSELDEVDAVSLLRVVANEKNAKELARMPNDILKGYVMRMACYPLAIKWIVGQVSLGKDIENALGELTSSSGDVVKFCFDHIFNNMLCDDDRMLLYCISMYEKELSRGVLSHLSNLSSDRLEQSLRKLTIASLITPKQIRTESNLIESRYDLLPLTKNYIRSRTTEDSRIYGEIRARREQVQNLVEEADRAGATYSRTLRSLGAETEEEKIAVTWIITAQQRNRGGNYIEAVEGFKKAADIAPKFSSIYSAWAQVESEHGFNESADELMRRASNLNPRDSTVWFIWGNMLKNQSKLDKALSKYKKAIALNPKNSPLHVSAAEMLKRLGRYEEAENYYNDASELVDNSYSKKHSMILMTARADNYKRWAESFSKSKKLGRAKQHIKEAMRWVKKAVKLDRKDKIAMLKFHQIAHEYGGIVEQVDGFHHAIKFYTLALVDNPKSIHELKLVSWACLKLVRGFLAEGNTDEARKYYNFGRKHIVRRGGSPLKAEYDRFAPLNDEQYLGKMINIVEDKGYGFAETDVLPGQTIFIHCMQFARETSAHDLEMLANADISFFLAKTPKGYEGRLISVRQ